MRLPAGLAERGGVGCCERISICGLTSQCVGTLATDTVQATTGEDWG